MDGTPQGLHRLGATAQLLQAAEAQNEPGLMIQLRLAGLQREKTPLPPRTAEQQPPLELPEQPPLKLTEQDEAATRVQAIMRGKQTRQEAAAAKGTRSAAVAAPAQTLAAKVAGDAVCNVVGQHDEAVPASPPPAVRPPIAMEDDDAEDAAAATVQAAMRSKQARKELMTQDETATNKQAAMRDKQPRLEPTAATGSEDSVAAGVKAMEDCVAVKVGLDAEG